MVELRTTPGCIYCRIKIHTQPLFARAAKDFPESTYQFKNHVRGILFRARYLTWRYFFESAMRKSSAIQASPMISTFSPPVLKSHTLSNTHPTIRHSKSSVELILTLSPLKPLTFNRIYTSIPSSGGHCCSPSTPPPLGTANTAISTRLPTAAEERPSLSPSIAAGSTSSLGYSARQHPNRRES